MSTVIGGRVALHGALGDGWVEVGDGRVASVGHGDPPRAPDERVAGVLAGGLTDLQVNGAAGHEVTGDDAALDAIEALLLARGVTSWLATVVTTDEASAARAVDRLAERVLDASSPIAGIHLEGPFLSPEHAGVHRPQLLRSPADGIPAYLRHPAVRMVTLAPELPGALDVVAELASAGVTVSLGHSGADAGTARAAVDAGARMVTHLFNAMGPFHHRAPGLAGVALTDERLAVGLIADGVHIDPLALSLVHRAAGGRVVLVSDASAAAGAPGRAVIAGVALDEHGRAPGGGLAGSLRLLDEDVGVWMRATGASLAESLESASARPAEVIGLPAPLDPGAPADLVEFDQDGRILRVMRAGRWSAG